MINDNLKERCLFTAKSIGDHISSLSDQNAFGIFWKSEIQVPSSSKRISIESESIYSGVSGILLFFLKLYSVTRNEKYLRFAKSSANWIESFCSANPTNYFAFHTGRLGASYVMIKLYDVTQEPEFLERALRIAHGAENFLEMKGAAQDYLTGWSGSVLGLLHLFSKTNDSTVLNTINVFIEMILENANAGHPGLYWDRSPQMVRGLCGLAHGASGVGYVFLELGHFFQNESFYWLADQAFLYEASNFNEDALNWPDYRKIMMTPETLEDYKMAFIEGKDSSFVSPSDLNAWCHGAVGIGLTRLRAFELNGKKKYIRELSTALQKTYITDVQKEFLTKTLTICHGRGGNASIFLESFKIFRKKRLLEGAIKIACDALEEKNLRFVSGYGDSYDDISLFMGSAGVGYFLLDLLDLDDLSTVQLPRVNTECLDDKIRKTISEKFSQEKMMRRLIKRTFPRTYYVLEKVKPGVTDEWANSNFSTNLKVDYLTRFVSMTNNAITVLEPQHSILVKTYLTLELDVVKMDQQIPSLSLLYIRDLVYQEKALGLLELDAIRFNEIELILEPSLSLKGYGTHVHIKKNEDFLESVENQDLKECFLLLRPSIKGVEETVLSPFAYLVFNTFERKMKVCEGIEIMLDSIELNNKSQKANETRGYLLHQIREGVKSRILVEESINYVRVQ